MIISYFKKQFHNEVQISFRPNVLMCRPAGSQDTLARRLK